MANKFSPVLCQIVFHQDEPVFSPTVPTDDVGGKDQLAGAAPASQVSTETSTPEIDTPMAIGGLKSSSNHTRPMEIIGVESELAADCKSDVTLEASSGVSDSNLNYSKSSDNLPVRSDNCMELASQIHELEKIHKDVRTDTKEFPHPGCSSPRTTRSTLQNFPARRPNLPKLLETTSLHHRY